VNRSRGPKGGNKTNEYPLKGKGAWWVWSASKRVIGWVQKSAKRKRPRGGGGQGGRDVKTVNLKGESAEKRGGVYNGEG